MGQDISMKSERKHPWFKPWFNIFCHSIRSMFIVLGMYKFGGGDENVVKKSGTKRVNTLCISSSGWIINKDQGGSKILHPSLSRVTDPWIYFLLCTLCIVPFTLSLIVQRKSNITCKTLIARACSHKQFSVKGFALKEENRECTNY